MFADAERKNKTPQKARKEKRDQLFKDYWNEEWMTKVKDDLPWPAFDCNMKEQVREDFNKTLEWMARLLVDREKGYKFEPLSPVEGAVTLHLTHQEMMRRNQKSRKIKSTKAS